MAMKVMAGMCSSQLWLSSESDSVSYCVTQHSFVCVWGPASSGLICKGQLVFHMQPSVVARCVYVILLQLPIAVANAGAELNEAQLFLRVEG